MIVMLSADVKTAQPSRRKSDPRKSRNRERKSNHNSLVCDYFYNDPIYDIDLFYHRFCMQRAIVKIVDAINNHSSYFTLMKDAIGRNSLSTLQKCIGAI